MKVKNSNFVYSVPQSELLDARHHNVEEIMDYLPRTIGTIKTVRVDYLIWKWLITHSKPIDSLGQVIECKNDKERAERLITNGLKFCGIMIRHHQDFSESPPTGLLC